MGEEGRNFRSYYYDKVGFRGVEEKKSLEMLLKDKPIDLAKLLKFCVCFSLPAMYREYVWKLLLDILPTNPESQKFVTDVQREQFNDLYHALEVMRKVNENTPLPEVVAQMFLLEEGNFWLDQEQQVNSISTSGEETFHVNLWIWDKVIGSSSAILAFVGAAMLITLRRTLLAMDNSEEVIKYIKKVPEDTADRVVNKALELWHLKQGGQQR
ncbi:TBC1 domain family member 7-like [Limulus polyphemus]|uniref:TBC1 domain family member 7-like n=1 Tax=Limulus polyphemus TaxID=6850 RepID=A0ABM1BIJ0_LIMPO|nr:TBC1 domain family member 7-like [Limulus polyphemus]